MKKFYMTPELSEAFSIEDVLLLSDSDNLTDSDFGSIGGGDPEDEWNAD